MTNIYLIRHGFTPANNAKYNNQRDLWKIAEDADMPLEMEYGEEQARELGQFLDLIPGKTLILVSPYHRTKQTLEIALREMTGDYEIRVCEDLHENDSGVHYAKTKEEVLEFYPEAEEFYQKIEDNPYETRYLGGECEYDVRARVKKVSERILLTSQANCYDNIFIFGHGTVNRWIYYWINGEIPPFHQKNCEVIPANGEYCGVPIFLPQAWVPLGYEVDIKKYLKK